MTLDTLKIAKDLQAASFTQPQAEALARVLAEREAAALGQLATKADLAALRSDMEHGLVQLEQRLVIKLGGMLVVAVGAVAALVKLL